MPAMIRDLMLLTNVLLCTKKIKYEDNESNPDQDTNNDTRFDSVNEGVILHEEIKYGDNDSNQNQWSIPKRKFKQSFVVRLIEEL